MLELGANGKVILLLHQHQGFWLNDIQDSGPCSVTSWALNHNAITSVISLCTHCLGKCQVYASWVLLLKLKKLNPRINITYFTCLLLLLPEPYQESILWLTWLTWLHYLFGHNFTEVMNVLFVLYTIITEKTFLLEIWKFGFN